MQIFITIQLQNFAPTQYMRNCLPISFWVLPTGYFLGRFTKFDDQYVNDVVSRKDVPFRGSGNRFYILTPFPPKRKFSVDFRRT